MFRCSKAVAALCFWLTVSCCYGQSTFYSETGTLVGVQGNRVSFRPDDAPAALDLQVTRKSLIRLYAPISLDYFDTGCVGLVTGTYDVDREVIEDAEFSVYLTAYDRRVAMGQAKEPHYDVRLGTFDEKRIRLEFYAVLTSMEPDPWKVKGVNRAHVSRYFIQEQGALSEFAPTQTFNTFGREFTLEPKILQIDDEKHLYVRLPANWTIDPETKPRGVVEYYMDTKEIRTIYLKFSEPITPKDLGIKRAKKKTRKSRSRK